MSSISKGTLFEDRVHQAIAEELDKGRLGFNKNSVQLHKKKGYYSRDRGSEIIVDISIELWLPAATNWSLLWVCECKDYSGTVPVNDVEEFKAKLDQISGANRKGVIATSGALQKSALSYAQANGIGVIRLLPDDQVEHVFYQLAIGASDPDRITASKVERALLNQNYIGRNNSFFGSINGAICSSWGRALKKGLDD